MTLDENIKRMQDERKMMSLVEVVATIAIILFVLFGVACLKALSQ